MALTASPTTPLPLATRNVRCLVVGEDLDFHAGSFALTVDEDMSVHALKHQVLHKMQTSHHVERIVSELQLFKGFDLYVSDLVGANPPGSLSPLASPHSSPRKSTTTKHAKLPTSAINDLLKTATPDKIANRYFQRKYAMRTRRSVGEYLPRSHKCDSERIDVLVSVPKLVLSEEVAEMADDEEADADEHNSFDYGVPDHHDKVDDASPRKRKRDPVVEVASTSVTMAPSKWQRAPCGRVVSVSTLRMRRHCHRCLAFDKQ